MFGIFRAILAALVVFQHFGGSSNAGNLAVFSFYTLSGFLMTLLMIEPYAGRPGAFLLNRALRIYPLYWTVCLVSVLIVLSVPVTSAHPLLGIPHDPWVVIRQLAFVSYWNENPLFVPPAWSVGNEIVYYVLIALGVSKSWKTSAIWLAVSIAYTIGVFVVYGGDIDLLYFSPLAASLPFAVGACVYHLCRAVKGKGALAALLVIVLPVSQLILIMSRSKLGLFLVLYSSLLASVGLIVELYFVERPIWLARVDDHFGVFSYPIYLLHFAIGALVLYFLPWHPGVGLAVVTLLSTTAAAWVVVRLVDVPVQMLRRKVRRRSEPTKAKNPAFGEALS